MYRNLINGARMMPQGYRLGERITKFEDAHKIAKQMQREDRSNNTYSVSGVAGNYHILKYEKKLIADPAFN